MEQEETKNNSGGRVGKYHARRAEAEFSSMHESQINSWSAETGCNNRLKQPGGGEKAEGREEEKYNTFTLMKYYCK